MPEDLRNWEQNTDYAAMKSLNEKFEEMEDLEEVRVEKYQQLVTVFDSFYQKHKSKTEEVSERIE